MEQLSVASMNQLYLGIQGLMEEEGDFFCRAQPPLLDVVLSGNPLFTRLVIFHHPLLFHPLSPSPSPSPSPLGPLLTPSKAFSDAKNTHKQAATCIRTLTHAHKERHTHTIRKSLKSFLILSVLSSLYRPQPILLSDCPKRLQFILKRTI